MSDVVDWEFLLSRPSPGHTAQGVPTYTLTMEDVHRVRHLGSFGGCVVTVPSDAQVPIPVGAAIGFNRVGNVTFVAASGVVITALPLTDAAERFRQGHSAILRKTGPNAWSRLGDLTLT